MPGLWNGLRRSPEEMLVWHSGLLTGRGVRTGVGSFQERFGGRMLLVTGRPCLLRLVVSSVFGLSRLRAQRPFVRVGRFCRRP
jgi:hypothetical protein